MFGKLEEEKNNETVFIKYNIYKGGSYEKTNDKSYFIIICTRYIFNKACPSIFYWWLITHISKDNEVEYIYEDEVFDDCSSELTLTCKSGTVAENYARENKLNYVLDYSDVITLIDTSYFTSPTNYNGMFEQGEGRVDPCEDNMLYYV